MNDANTKKAGWKSKAIHEMIEYYIISMYLTFFFGSFTWYRRLILAEYRISYLHYGAAVVQALVFAKVIMIGRALHLGQRLKDHPLIVPTIYKAILFSIFVELFDVIESTVIGLLQGKGITRGFEDLVNAGWDALLAKSLIMFVAFIPFFAFDELEQALGGGKLKQLLFQRGLAAESNPTKHEMP
jgi:hypothetical protein